MKPTHNLTLSGSDAKVTAILGGVVLLVLALGWLWFWLVRNEGDLKKRWHMFLHHPRMTEFLRRFAPQIRFLQERLSPEGYLGLHLTVGALIILAAGWSFGGVVEDLLTGDPLISIDVLVAAWFHECATPRVTNVAILITSLGSPPFLGGASLATALFLAWRRWWHRLLALGLTMGGGTLLIILLKTIFHRPRPIFENPLVSLASYSFPSGHTMGSTLLAGSLAFILATSLKAWRWRVLSIFSAFLFVLLIALTRIYLGAHYLSDVLGAMAAGLLWLALCLTAVETYRRRPIKQQTV